jgi:hypothetical protein
MRSSLTCRSLVGFVVLAMGSCKTPTSEGAGVSKAPEGTPPWVAFGNGPFLCSGDEILRGVGQQKLANENLAKLGANRSALEALEKVVEAWVTFLVRNYYATYEKRGRIVTGRLGPLVRGVRRLAMEKAKIVETFRGSDHTTFVLAEVRVRAAREAWHDLNLDLEEKNYLIDHALTGFRASDRKLVDVCAGP